MNSPNIPVKDPEWLDLFVSGSNCLSTNISTAFFDNLKEISGMDLIKSQKNSEVLSGLVNIQVSEIFRSLYLSKKVLDFLKLNGAPLSLVLLYNEIVDRYAGCSSVSIYDR